MGRPITVQVGPLATADADGVSVSQTVPAARYMALSGALTNGTTANNVAQSQTPTGAGAAVTLNGTLASSVPTGSAVAYLGRNERIYITSAADISNRTFTITGLFMTPGVGLTSQTEVLTGPNNTVVASQQQYYSISSIIISNTAAGAITIGRAGFATLDVARRIIFTSSADDTDITFTVVGTDWAGNPMTEVVTGASGGVASTTVSFKTVTSILTSGASSGTVQVGTNGVADSPWVRLDTYGATGPTAIQVNGSGTVNWTVRQTLSDPNAYGDPAYGDPDAAVWVDHPDSSLVASAVTTGVQGNYAYPPIFAKVVMNSGTGTVWATFAQQYQD